MSSEGRLLSTEFRAISPPCGGNIPMNAHSLYWQRFVGFYFQDDWRVTPKPTLNLGLRWD
jgi:outer membrane receptor protein involved in Fe transport